MGLGNTESAGGGIVPGFGHILYLPEDKADQRSATNH